MMPNHDIRVLHLSTLDCGGAGIAAYRLHCGLTQIGIDSHMWVLHKSTNDPKVQWAHDSQYATFNRKNILTWPDLRKKWDDVLKCFPNRSRSLCFFSTPDSTIKLKKQIQEFDIINLHWIAGFIDIKTMPIFFSGKKIFWTLHDMNPFTGGCHYAQDCTRYENTCHDCPQLGPGSKDIVNHAWNIKKENYRHLDLTVITPSKWLGNCSRNSALLGRFSQYVVPNGLDLEDYQPIDRLQARQTLGLPNDAKIVLFGASAIGDYRKGFDLFLEAITRLPSILKEVKIVLIAFGHSVHLDKINIPYKFIHLGHLNSTKQLRAAYSAADVFVISTREDNLPNTVLESLACGTPIVGFDLGGLPDLIEHQKTGYLAPFPDIDEMAKGIKWVLSHYGELRSYCRQKAINEFSLDLQARRYRDLYLSNN